MVLAPQAVRGKNGELNVALHWLLNLARDMIDMRALRLAIDT